MTTNPTNKPNLSSSPTLVKHVNITTLICSLRILVEASYQLQEFYFFYRIPKAWIDIKDTNKDDRPTLSSTIIEANEAIAQLQECRYIKLPITQYSDIANTINTLRYNFLFRGFLISFFQVLDLLAPDWDMFNNYGPHLWVYTHTIEILYLETYKLHHTIWAHILTHQTWTHNY